ncbi:MAG: homoserine dehydrogenase [Methanomicrobiales archaeon]|jgi:homoserine dehydrogenase|nr:homoserine dehydrogenase [Methanoregulaceae archaeon]NLH25026.1 homoserine dehydrogenase [Methanomicrobiales archaeon]HNI41538.1 homoserine dehydrogenase [Methanoregulaceae archaeon]HNL85641.1 homoserine dehydrogenase [Methanoregulaceae archaeon]HNO08527.1 homoserine dehydrogenase [Methanoregulaceae archaeon]
MKIAILGMGSVGRGLLEMIDGKELGLMVTGIADSKSALMDPDGIHIEEVLMAKRERGYCGDKSLSAADVVERCDYDVLVEVTPTDADSGEPATGFMKTAIGRGKHVVTSNKGPIALHFSTLQSLARKHGVVIRYEATVGGAIPVMHTLEHGLAGNRVLAVYGILNGTSNFILTRMAAEGLTYEQALLEAREMGYAEADPTYDVKGIDAAIKLVILSNTIWKRNVKLSDVTITGIDMLTNDALRLAEDQHCTIRLIAEAIPEKGILRVAPRILPRTHPLVVENTLNAITIDTDMAGEITLIGKGAGSRETASACIGDLLFIKDSHARGN